MTTPSADDVPAPAALPAGARLRDPSEVPSKTIATWLGLVGGSLGLHHFYLHGLRSRLGWLYPLPTLVGLFGVLRMRDQGVDDRLAWALVPWLGLTISVGMLCAIVIGLSSDARWARRWAIEPPQPAPPDDDETPPPGIVATGWGPVLGVILALMIGGGVLMGTIAFCVEHVFYL